MKTVTDRIINSVRNGRDSNAEHALKVLKSDERRLLEDYFDFDPKNLKMTADLLADGNVSLTITLKAKRFKTVGKTLD